MVRSQDLDHHVLEFQAVLGFPNAIGALDGCHLPVFPPKNSAVHYRNYKGWYSVILLALVDHRYRFRYVNVGFPGKFHDANVYGRSPSDQQWVTEALKIEKDAKQEQQSRTSSPATDMKDTFRAALVSYFEANPLRTRKT
ncbi:hypothetical protein HPB47_022857 [Ixodes persulcatus]|uniref:Uncharacterized protein n=1 Tax=Ixodes persulcatus TaxID=34615 RepID=A0AC60Q8K3_IXOPE|nr:hypothetical protein HPB47_022857 [Ixodes persulcatus]